MPQEDEFSTFMKKFFQQLMNFFGKSLSLIAVYSTAFSVRLKISLITRSYIYKADKPPKKFIFFCHFLSY